MTTRGLLLALSAALCAACATPVQEPPASPGRVADALVVPEEALNPDVRQETIQQTICVPGYAASIRPATSYTNGVKLKLLRERKMPAAMAPDHELDHRVPLSLGGHPRNLKNLELQPWEGEDGATMKDRVERRLQRLVCSGKLMLREAQRTMYFEWQAARQRP